MSHLCFCEEGKICAGSLREVFTFLHVNFMCSLPVRVHGKNTKVKCVYVGT